MQDSKDMFVYHWFHKGEKDANKFSNECCNIIGMWLRKLVAEEGYETLTNPANNQLFPWIRHKKNVFLFMLQKESLTSEQLELVEADTVFDLYVMSRKNLRSENRFEFFGKIKVSRQSEKEW